MQAIHSGWQSNIFAKHFPLSKVLEKILILENLPMLSGHPFKK